MSPGSGQFRHPITIARIETFAIRASTDGSPKMALGVMQTRPALLIRVEDRAGGFGWGEIWANFPPRANLHKAHLIEDVIAAPLQDLVFCDPREVQDALRKSLSVYFLHIGQMRVFEHILAGLDTALWDLALRNAGQSFAEFIGLQTPSAPCYASSINAEDLATRLPYHAKLGQRYFKLKIGFADHGTRDFVKEASGLCPQGSRLMVDSNQSWTLDQAKSCLSDIEEFAPFFAEEALRADAQAEDWEELAASTAIPLAGGENIYGIEGFLAMTRVGMRVLQPDIAKWGGVSGALELASAVPDDILIWPHFMGTAIGQIAALSVTAALGERACCEMDVNANPLRTALCGAALEIRAGRISLQPEPGLVVPPDPACLDAFADPPH